LNPFPLFGFLGMILAINIGRADSIAAIRDIYAIKPDGSQWPVPQDFDVNFNWDYEDGRAAMMGLVSQGRGDAVERRNPHRLEP